MECRHHSTEEVQDDQALRKLGAWTRSARPRLVIADEARQYKALGLVGDMDAVSVGTARYGAVGLGRAMSPRVMPTAPDYRARVEREGGTEFLRTHRARTSCGKWERMAPARQPGRSRTSVVNMRALEDILGDLE